MHVAQTHTTLSGNSSFGTYESLTDDKSQMFTDVLQHNKTQYYDVNENSCRFADIGSNNFWLLTKKYTFSTLTMCRCAISNLSDRCTSMGGVPFQTCLTDAHPWEVCHKFPRSRSHTQFKGNVDPVTSKAPCQEGLGYSAGTAPSIHNFSPMLTPSNQIHVPAALNHINCSGNIETVSRAGPKVGLGALQKRINFLPQR